MQKITYENLLGERTELSARQPYILESVTGVGATDAEILTTRGVYQSGLTTRRTVRLKRTVKAKIALYGARTREELYQARKGLNRLLSLPRCFDEATGAMGRLIYENDAGRYWAYALPETPPEDGARTANTLSNMTVTFQCDSPYWNEFEECTQVLRMGDGGFRLPFQMPVRFGTAAFEAACENEGAIDAPVRIVIEGSGETPEIRNLTTGATLRIEHPVATEERLLIETDPEKLSVRIERADGTSESAFGYLDAQSAVTAFTLRPGRNQVRYVPSLPSNASRVTLTWRTRHEGV